MDIGSIFLFLGLLILVGIFISRPFFERSATAMTQEEHEYSALLAERDRLLDALQELDFDYALGKIPEGEYPAQRAALLQRGAATLQQLDALQPGDADEDAEARIEAAIAARRALSEPALNGAGGTPVPATPDDDLEAIIANRRRARSEKAAGFCPQCGRPVQKSDRFCPGCGTTLE
ncbi:MAG: zinc-ribbon domain-containing protein [Anaerolineales bacterium]|jgi:hypothetical protein|nr:zinc-ribbon domain-containing protein [Anaerolineales bacterium]MCK5314421.1 zinc-ribbon domain-containing protein [Anaerolineales bacterium]MCK5430569.1 zinc-ribbon domain-containing protein [Anaerolineales bacterium]